MCDKLIYRLLVIVLKITNQKYKNWLLNVLSFFIFRLATIKITCIWRTFVYYTSCLIQTLLARPGINEFCLNLLNAKRLHRKHVNKMNLRVIITVVHTRRNILKKRDCPATISILFFNKRDKKEKQLDIFSFCNCVANLNVGNGFCESFFCISSVFGRAMFWTDHARNSFS